jgi:hypothetical protein
MFVKSARTMVALAYLTRARQNGKLSDPVATFHFSNGARLERINVFGNLRSYGLEASFGVTAGYQYVASEVEENHERFVRDGHVRVAKSLCLENAIVSAAWQGARQNRQRDRNYHSGNVVRRNTNGFGLV